MVATLGDRSQESSAALSIPGQADRRASAGDRDDSLLEAAMSTRYMFLIYGDESRLDEMTPETWDQMLQAHNAWSASVVAAGASVISGEALAPSGTSTTVRQGDGGPVLTDGPFIETKEALGGYYVIDCADLDQALAFARTLPGETVEVRPVIPTD
jgi:hypothetical protein